MISSILMFKPFAKGFFHSFLMRSNALMMLMSHGGLGCPGYDIKLHPLVGGAQKSWLTVHQREGNSKFKPTAFQSGSLGEIQ